MECGQVFIVILLVYKALVYELNLIYCWHPLCLLFYRKLIKENKLRGSNNMTIYKQKSFSITKVILGIVVFVLGMTVTFSDAYGVSIPTYESGKNAEYGMASASFDADMSLNSSSEYVGSGYGFSAFSDSYSFDRKGGFSGYQAVTVPIPEPSTLLLLMGGLGLMRALRRK